jgi:hypothetical protein
MMCVNVMRVCAVAVLVMCTSASRAAVLSGNLIQGGDFEDTSYLKNSGSFDNQNNYVPLHRFNQDTDLGMWIATFGPPSLSEGANAGFSLYDDPRTDAPGNTHTSGDLGNINRSVDPYRPDNHVLETVMFRPRTAQWVAAPENHVPGPIHLSFDFYLNRWDPFGGENSSSSAAAVWFQLELYGMNELPAHDTPYVEGPAVWPRDAVNSGALSGEMLARFNWGDPWSWLNTPEIDGNDNGWLSVSSDDMTHWNFDPNVSGSMNGKGDVLTTELTQTFPYYALALRVRVYDEQHPYLWLYDGQIVDTVSLMYDNFVFQVSVEDDCVVPDAVAGDFSGDGNVNTADINPFILALTNLQAWLDYIRPLLGECLTDEQLIAYADPNQDGQINTADIVPFINLLTGGAPAIIPEPGSIALLGLGTLVLLRRRR